MISHRLILRQVNVVLEEVQEVAEEEEQVEEVDQRPHSKEIQKILLKVYRRLKRK
jgi:hypothetical protein